MRKLLVATALLFGMTLSASAGEFKNYCTQGLAQGEVVKTDCSVHEQIDGKTYCFGNEAAKTEFNKNQKANLKKAEKYFSTLK